MKGNFKSFIFTIKKIALKKIFHIFGKVLLSIVALIILLILLIQTDLFQNWAIQKVTTRLSKDLNTEVKVKHISISFFNSLNLDGTLIKDLHKDTLLYTEQLKLRITDWFFVKNEMVIKYFELNDAYINLHRKDSIWNYQFLIDHFSSNTQTQQKKSTLRFNLKKIECKNVVFNQNDEWIGALTLGKVARLQLEANDFNLDKKSIDLQEIILDRPVYSVTTFEGKRLKSAKIVNLKPVNDLYFNTGDIHLTVGKISIKNGTYENMLNNHSYNPALFDPQMLRLEKINGNILGVSFIKDTIKANIDIALKERCGFEIKKLKTNFRLTPQIMEFASLTLLTPKSRLQNYYAMQFTDFNKDLKNYVEKVTMLVDFKNAEINSDDIGFFAPEAKSWKRRILISGNGKGTVTNLTIKNLFAKIGNNTSISGNLSVVGLPEINKTKFDFTAGNLQTNYNDMSTFIPALVNVDVPNLASLGDVKFNGHFHGTLDKFTTDGNYSTNLGGFSTNIAMELPKNSSPIYSGRVITRQFNIGKFLAVKDVGTVSFDVNIKGVGLTLNTLKTSVQGNINNLVFKDYTYKSMNVEGVFQKKQFDGTVKIDDDNISLITTVKMDFKGDLPHFNVLGDLAKSDFQKLNLYKKRLEISGLFDLNFSGKNIDQFLGSVKIYNTNILHDSVRVNLDSLTLESGFENGKRSLALKSNEVDALIEGRYNILDLPNAFQLFLHNYYPAYIAAPSKSVQDQSFNFFFNTKNIEGYSHLISKDMTGFSNSSISGTINTLDTLFELNADIPEFTINKRIFTAINFTGRGNLNSLQIKGDIGNIQFGDSTNFPNTNIQIVSENNISQVKIKTRANNTLNELNLNANLTSYSDGLKVDFNPSDFVINDKRWILEKKGEIIIRKNFVSAENVRFSQSDQHIDVQTTYDEAINKSNLIVKLQNINLNDFAPFFIKDTRVEGLVSGEAVMKDFFGKFNIESDLRAEYFRFDNDSIGLVNIKGNYNSTTGKIGFNVKSENEFYNFLGAGSYNLSDTTGLPLTTSIILNNTKVNILNKFLNTIFTDINGLATGELRINGNPSKPDLLGKVKLKNGSLIVNFSKVQYFIDSANFAFTNEYIDFGKFNIKDKFGNSGIVSGKMFQHQFKDVKFNLDLSTKKLLLMDTKSTDNSQFYGLAIGKANMTIRGPQENIHISITAEPVDSSHIYIPTNATKESSDADFIVFKQYGTEMENYKAQGESNVIVDLDLTANPLAKIDVILDPITGDVIKANGSGRLRIHAGTTDNLTINGRYEIQKGSYDFNFQSFIKKPFIFREEAHSFIEWNGNPYNAKMQIEALYVAERVRLGDLVGAQNLGGSVQGYQGDVYVIANITGKLTKPDIKFQIDFPAGTIVKNDETFVQFLSKLERDENEMLKQVTYLIVFGSFAPYGEGRKIEANLATLGYNTLSELLSKQVNSVVSNILYKITGDRSLQFDVSTSVYSSGNLFSGNVTATNAIDRQKVNFKIGKSLLNNKVIVTFGGDLDFRMGSNTATSQQLGNLQWLPDLTVELVLSKDRRIRAIIFSRNNLDISAGAVGRLSRQGASLSYRKDFKGYSIEKKKKPTKDKNMPAPAVLTKNDDEQP